MYWTRRPSRTTAQASSHEQFLTIGSGHTLRNDPRSYGPLNQQGRRASPEDLHSSSEQSGSPARKRVQVACGRCRKRKIRCSGDPGDGSSCSNCKSAGDDAKGSCKFLRVLSNQVDLGAPSDSVPLTPSYPYSGNHLATSSMPHLGSYGPYTGNSSSIPGSSSGRLANSTYLNRQYCNVPGKQTFASPYTFFDENDYGISAPTYPLPSQEIPTTTSQSYAAHDPLKGWSQVLPTSKSSSGNGLFIEQECTPPYSGSALPYLNAGLTARMPQATPDGHTFFPNLTTLTSSLPVSSPAGGRILPHPTRHQRTSMPIARNHSVDGELSEMPYNVPHDYSNRGNFIHSSIDPVPPPRPSGGPTDVTPPEPQQVEESATRDESAVSYPMPVSPRTNLSSITPSHSFSGGPVGTTSSNYNTSSTAIYPPATSGSQVLRQGSDANLYSFSSDMQNYRRNSGSSAEGTLANGQPYTRHGPPAHNQSSVENLRRREDDSRPQQLAHRVSVGSFHG